MVEIIPMMIREIETSIKEKPPKRTFLIFTIFVEFQRILVLVLHTVRDNSSVIVIPARLNSSRFPRKILEPINGKLLIIHVWERAKQANLCDCYVACCCEEVRRVVENYGGKAIVTNPDLPSGTDRVFEAVGALDVRPEYIINLQGDTPVFDTTILKDILDVLKSNPEIDMTTPVTLQENLDDFNNENTVKVVFNNMEKHVSGKAIYFSRSAIPNGLPWFYSHIGIYAYRYNALEKFIGLPQSFLEKMERLEQLRAIQNNINVWAVPVNGTAISVDVREDLDRVCRTLLAGE